MVKKETVRVSAWYSTSQTQSSSFQASASESQ